MALAGTASAASLPDAASALETCSAIMSAALIATVTPVTGPTAAASSSSSSSGAAAMAEKEVNFSGNHQWAAAAD